MQHLKDIIRLVEILNSHGVEFRITTDGKPSESNGKVLAMLRALEGIRPPNKSEVHHGKTL